MSGHPDRDPNRLRWGDLFTANIPALTNVTNQTLQIVNARSPELPETWTVFLFAQVETVPVDPAVTSCVFKITLGVGASTVTFNYAFEFNSAFTNPPVVTPYAQFLNLLQGWHELTIPAKDIQIQCLVVTAGSNVNPQHVQVGAWVAPRVPLATHLAHEANRGGEHERQGGWMPHGFHPEKLEYK
jgi:hypothetical protein